MSAGSTDNPRTASAADALGHVAALVEGVPEGAGRGQAVGLGVARHQAPRPEHVLGRHVAVGVEFADGDAAVVEVVGAYPRSGLLSTPQAALSAIGCNF